MGEPIPHYIMYWNAIYMTAVTEMFYYFSSDINKIRFLRVTL